MPGGACELVMDVCNFHCLVREGFIEVVICESRPEAVNLAERKPGLLSRRNNKGPGRSVPEELQELPGGQRGFGRWRVEPRTSRLL